MVKVVKMAESMAVVEKGVKEEKVKEEEVKEKTKEGVSQKEKSQ